MSRKDVIDVSIFFIEMPNVGQGKKTEKQVNIIVCLLTNTINK